MCQNFNNQIMSNKFWAVMEQDGQTTQLRRHETKEAAVEQASKLAKMANASYCVLELVGVVRPVAAPVEYVDVTDFKPAREVYQDQAEIQ